MSTLKPPYDPADYDLTIEDSKVYFDKVNKEIDEGTFFNKDSDGMLLPSVSTVNDKEDTIRLLYLDNSEESCVRQEKMPELGIDWEFTDDVLVVFIPDSFYKKISLDDQRPDALAYVDSLSV